MNKINKRQELFDKIKEAKETIGDEAARIIAKEMQLENWDETKLTSKSLWNENDNTPSMVWNPKDYCFKDFSTGKTFGMIDMYEYIYKESYMDAVKRLFDAAKIEYDVSIFKKHKEEKEDFFKNYKYPKEITNTNRSKVEDYLSKRGITTNTLDKLDVKQALDGSVAFEFRDIDNRLVAIKYRHSRALKSGEYKMWWDKDADMCPSLYNINHIDFSKPLLIVEGMIDALSCVEAGYTNTVSIHGGAEDISWIEFNYDLLESFDDIILWFDNDTAGQNGLVKTINRLGEYRCKIVKPSSEYEDKIEGYYKNINSQLSIRKTDANNILISCGKSDIISLINSAEEIPDENIKYLMDYEPQDIKDIEKISTGFANLDKELYGSMMSCFTIISGKSGAGKSTIANIAAIISPIENGYKTFVYSGELANGQLSSWVISPLAGQNHTVIWKNEIRDSYSITKQASERIRQTYRKDILLYDDKDGLDTSSTSLLRAMEYAYKKYNCRFFLIDNLMSLSFEGYTEDTKWDCQKAFIIQLLKFTNKYNVSTFLVVHPSKSGASSKDGGTPDVYSLSGSGDISNMAHRILYVDRIENDPEGYGVRVSILKDRISQRAFHSCKLFYDEQTRRIYSNELELLKKYRWETDGEEIEYPDNVKPRLVCNLKNKTNINIKEGESPF